MKDTNNDFYDKVVAKSDKIVSELGAKDLDEALLILRDRINKKEIKNEQDRPTKIS